MLLPTIRKTIGKEPKQMTVVDSIVGHSGQVPEHIKSLRIPPAWSGVKVDPDPNAKCWASGVDVKGRLQRIYSSFHTLNQSKIKFDRISHLLKQVDTIRSQIEIDCRLKPGKSNRRFRNDEPICAYLVFCTGIRPGSTTDTLADKQAYGATTLQARHIKVMASGRVWLHFTGKKGVTIHLRVTNPWLCEFLIRRKDGAQGKYTTPIFQCNAGSLNRYVKELGDGSASPKDFRTLLGNQIAARLLNGKRLPSSKTKAKKLLRSIYAGVAKVLGNTPAISKKSYINPEITKPLVFHIESL